METTEEFMSRYKKMLQILEGKHFILIEDREGVLKIIFDPNLSEMLVADNGVTISAIRQPLKSATSK